MSFNTQTFRIVAQLEAGNTPTIYNVTSPGTANTEFSQALASGTKKFMIRNRDKSDIQLAFNSGESGTLYITIPGCSTYTEDLVKLGSVTLYMQIQGVSETIEILEWT